MIRPPPFRAEHIGSLVRPPELLRARQQHAAGDEHVTVTEEVERAKLAQVVEVARQVWGSA